MTPTAPELGSEPRRSVLRDAVEHSSFVGAVRALRYTTRRVDWRRSSTAWRLLARSGNIVSAAAASSVATRSIRSLAAWMRTSFLYRWLTKEPEPEIIVIDLRDTMTAGPLIEGLDRLSSVLRPAVRRSTLVEAAVTVEDELRQHPVRTVSLAVLVGAVASLGLNLLGGRLPPPELVLHVLIASVAALGTRVTTPWAELREARTVQLLAAVLEPPAFPGETVRSTDYEERRITVDEERPVTTDEERRARGTDRE